MLNQYLDWAHSLTQEWFIKKFIKPTVTQIQSWPAILAKQHTLISAPTGTGKTLAAFLIYIDYLIKQSVEGKLNNTTQIIYISPLKALSNDIYKNLMVPLNEISTIAKEHYPAFHDIRVAVRTGDTPNKERQSILKKPPHILVTTPESFYILLTAQKSRNILSQVHTIIIDEIHVLANNKRGAHLMLSLERLEALTQKETTRIGLSATQKPIELVGQFLTGYRSMPKLINMGYGRQLKLWIETPSIELSAVASNEIWEEIYNKIAKLTEKNRSILIFVNTRKLAERVAHHLADRLGKDQVLAHHGSLSRKLRLHAENKLKCGELKALVATASLELGIDVGTIDLVCQIGSPRAINIALQRVGRSGHWYQATSQGVFFATTRDELIECAALVEAIHSEDLDQLIVPTEPLDILSQQIVAMCANESWKIKDLFALIKKTFSYADLTWETFHKVISILANGVSGARGRYSAYLFYDEVNEVISGRRGARLAAIMNGGAIPDNALFTVLSEPDQLVVGTLDEDFAIESNYGDIILLGSTSWKIKRIENRTGRVIVEDAHGAPPTVPFWRGDAPARTDELSLYVSNLRQKINSLLENTIKIAEWLQTHCGLDANGCQQLIQYLLQGKKVLGEIPTQKMIIAERFFDESGGMQLIIHAPFGARINKAWGLALRKRFCHSFNFELQASATDNGLNISLAEQHSFNLVDVFHYLHPATLKETLIQAILPSPLFNTRWRFVAIRSLALPKFRGGKKIPPNILRMLSDDLLAAVFPDAQACQDNLAGKKIILPDHPLIKETMKEILTDALDFQGLSKILTSLMEGTIHYYGVDTPFPSAFSHELLNANPYAFLDDAPLEERRARAISMRMTLPDAMLTSIGQLDIAVIQQVQNDIHPDIRHENELQDFLQTVIAFPIDKKFIWQRYCQKLISAKRSTIAIIKNQKFLVAAEKTKTFLSIYPEALFTQTLKQIEEESPVREQAILKMLQGWMFYLGPISNLELSHKLHLALPDIDQALIQLENTGLILRGQFTQKDTNTVEWCERRLLARIHRETLRKLRKEIAPVTQNQFMYWLLTWQFILPNHQLKGETGLLEVIKQLQGFEISSNAWEKQIFSKRIKDYHKDMLDKLCLSGVVGWGRVSPLSNKNKTRIHPTSTTPITFFLREDSDWLRQTEKFEDLTKLSHIARDIYFYLKEKGAHFFIDIVNNVNHLKPEVEMGLWELVTAGLVTADGFDNLRLLIDKRRRLNHRRYHITNYMTARWSILNLPFNIEDSKKLESICWSLLLRYGIIFRDLLIREKNLPSWRNLLITLRHLESQGKIRGGRFVEGFSGEQFALPYAVESLRSAKKHFPQQIEINLSAADPLNLLGILVEGNRISSLSKKEVHLKFFIELAS